jgi:protein tyrosine phosphatase (PTP) superfamily phosphohydrolase (DUF442 family)
MGRGEGPDRISGSASVRDIREVSRIQGIESPINVSPRKEGDASPQNEKADNTWL